MNTETDRDTVWLTKDGRTVDVRRVGPDTWAVPTGQAYTWAELNALPGGTVTETRPTPA